MREGKGKGKKLSSLSRLLDRQQGRSLVSSATEAANLADLALPAKAACHRATQLAAIYSYSTSAKCYSTRAEEKKGKVERKNHFS